MREHARVLALGVAVMATVVLGSNVRALDGCREVLSAEAEAPPCCKKDAGARIAEAHRDCCTPAALADHDPAATSAGASPDVPAAAAVTLPLSMLGALAVESAGRPLPLARDGPKDRRPPTSTTVLLV